MVKLGNLVSNSSCCVRYSSVSTLNGQITCILIQPERGIRSSKHGLSVINTMHSSCCNGAMEIVEIRPYSTRSSVVRTVDDRIVRGHVSLLLREEGFKNIIFCKFRP